MSAFSTLAPGVRELFGLCALLVMTGALFVLVNACTLRAGWRLIVLAALTAAAAVLIAQTLGSVEVKPADGEQVSRLLRTAGRMPWLAAALLLALPAAAAAGLWAALRRRRDRQMTPEVIKESLDALPDGVCFFTAGGQPLLVNRQMNRLCGELCGTELLNAASFWDRLEPAAEPGQSGEGRLVTTGDGRTWDFRKNPLGIGGGRLWEITACDVTGQYRLGRELERRNASLRRVNERLRLYSREVERITREEEILKAKIRVHDDVGRTLLAFRSYLAQPDGARDREGLLFLWRSATAMMRNETTPQRTKSDWELLLQAAEAVNVRVEAQGELPSGRRERGVVMMALRECLTNTVKHAGGDSMSIVLRRSGGRLTAEISNSGAPPRGRIQETGGLLDLRRSVEAAGGSMEIWSAPRFLLRLTLPEGEDDEWQKQE